jgi:hypothetical protein
MTPVQGASGVTVADAGELLAEVAPALVEQVIKALGAGETPIEIGGKALASGLSVLAGGLLDLAEGASLEQTRRKMDDAVLAILADIKFGAPALPL